MADYSPAHLPGSSVPTASVTLKSGNEHVQFVYPDIGTIREHLENIFSGREYIAIDLPGFQPQLVLDIGANIGASGYWFHQLYPHASVYCYEPSATNFVFLQKNLGSRTNIHLHNCGLFDKVCQAKLFRGVSQSMQNSVVRSGETDDDFEIVHLKRASEESVFLELAKTDVSAVLKLDTEGCEVPILADLSEAGLLGNVDLLYLEYHSERDRVRIEHILTGANQFMLAHAQASAPHRGRNVYISSRLVRRFPSLSINQIGSNT